ncbi:MAG: hypothetical protein JNL01_13350 [Bdellovibrionales bacterium]|nr:hypothetical protein [Bdellovibrionales bacterium]
MKTPFILFVLGLSISPAVFGQTSSAGLRTPWEEISNEDGIRVFRREMEGSPFKGLKGIGVVDAPIAKVSAVLDDTTRRMEWVANSRDCRTLKRINDYERIEYNHAAVPWPFQDRDFVFHASVAVNPEAKEIRILMKSVEDPLMPKRSGIVRGLIHQSNYLLREVDGGKRTLISVEVEADPAGEIPSWLVNTFQKGWARQMISGIREQVAKPGITEMAMVRDALDGKIQAPRIHFADYDSKDAFLGFADQLIVSSSGIQRDVQQ